MEDARPLISRCTLIVGGAVATAGLAAAPSAFANEGAASSAGGGRGAYAHRAQESYAAMQRHFYRDRP